jgi:co-chaperonin GroES (HSP10)
MDKMHPMMGKILVKKYEVQEEASGFLLNNEAEKFLACGEILQDFSTWMSNPAVVAVEGNVHQVDFHKGDKVYYQKSKGYDTHNPDYQVVNLTDIIYVEEA